MNGVHNVDLMKSQKILVTRFISISQTYLETGIVKAHGL